MLGRCGGRGLWVEGRLDPPDVDQRVLFFALFDFPLDRLDSDIVRSVVWNDSCIAQTICVVLSREVIGIQ